MSYPLYEFEKHHICPWLKRLGENVVYVCWVEKDTGTPRLPNPEKPCQLCLLALGQQHYHPKRHPYICTKKEIDRTW